MYLILSRRRPYIPVIKKMWQTVKDRTYPISLYLRGECREHIVDNRGHFRHAAVARRQRQGRAGCLCGDLVNMLSTNGEAGELLSRSTVNLTRKVPRMDTFAYSDENDYRYLREHVNECPSSPRCFCYGRRQRRTAVYLVWTRLWVEKQVLSRSRWQV